jgi:hypothetical protein
MAGDVNVLGSRAGSAIFSKHEKGGASNPEGTLIRAENAGVGPLEAVEEADDSEEAALVGCPGTDVKDNDGYETFYPWERFSDSRIHETAIILPDNRSVSYSTTIGISFAAKCLVFPHVNMDGNFTPVSYSERKKFSVTKIIY